MQLQLAQVKANLTAVFFSSIIFQDFHDFLLTSVHVFGLTTL